MHLSTSFPLVVISLLLAWQASSLPIGEEQQPVFFKEENTASPTSYSQNVLGSTIRDVLVANAVIGDVLDDFDPSYYLDIKYPKSHETVLLGNDIPVDAVSSRPVFTFHSVDDASYPARKHSKAQHDPPISTEDKPSAFTLILTDPDAKSRAKPKWSEMCHWIITNLTTPLTLTPQDPPFPLKAKAGELEEYLPPGPPPKTGAHRYVFVLLEGDTTDLKAPSDRQHWGYDGPRHGVRDWAKENDLTVVGANFFFAQNEKQ